MSKQCGQPCSMLDFPTIYPCGTIPIKKALLIYWTLCFHCQLLSVHSCKVDQTTANHGGEESWLLTVPVHSFIWEIGVKEDMVN